MKGLSVIKRGQLTENFVVAYVSVATTLRSCQVPDAVWTTGNVMRPNRLVIAAERTTNLVCEEGWRYSDRSSSKTYQCSSDGLWNSAVVRCTSEF